MVRLGFEQRYKENYSREGRGTDEFLWFHFSVISSYFCIFHFFKHIKSFKNKKRREVLSVGTCLGIYTVHTELMKHKD